MKMVARSNGKEIVLGCFTGKDAEDMEQMDIIGTPSISNEDEARVLAELGPDATFHIVE